MVPIGLRPDGKPIGDGRTPIDLPICPGNGLVLFQKEFSAADKATIEGLIADSRYKALAGRHQLLSGSLADAWARP